MSKTKPNDAHVGALAADRPKILLVEDDAGVRRSVQLLLQAQGFDVRAYAAGTSLIADEKSANAICLVADFRLEDHDGIAVLTALRARGWMGPAILVTAFASADVWERARAAGFGEILEKPLKDHVLVRAVLRAAMHQVGEQK